MGTSMLCIAPEIFFLRGDDREKRRAIESLIPARVRVHLSIPEYAFCKDNWGMTYTVYLIRIERERGHGLEHGSWTVYRRYNDFHELYQRLLDEGYELPELPPKRILGNFDPEFLEHRRDQLDTWLSSVMSIIFALETTPQDSLLLREFFVKDANVPPEGICTAPKKPSDKISEADFDCLRVLGQGAFGKVVLVRKRETDQLYAMKVLKKDFVLQKGQAERTRYEREVLAHAKHPFIVHLHYAFQTDEKLFFVMDYCPGGELFFHLKRYGSFDEHIARFFAAELVLALEYLHRLGIVYRDLKPENVLLDADGHVNLVDFGLSKGGIVKSYEGASSICGSPEYLAPEVLLGRGHGKAVDWWSLGSLLYELLTGLPAFFDSDRKTMFEKILFEELTFPPHISPEAQSLISALLTREPEHRLGSHKDGAEVRAHAFFASIDWNALLTRNLESPFIVPNCETVASTLQNFEDQFTRLPIVSMDEPRDSIASLEEDGIEKDSKNQFMNFSYTEESVLHL
eukprot:TRINITY_DN20230_c0_g1::TRINITY_DN20230_c0_g1_i1::g.30313::m.30313 TRINITY_DN20230_c0_g1::TRINITY_DN20230_c0_g1_i1::g.30313  ORF type:complete len:514 (-),score=40.82,sp/P28178/PK2_DICDI/46.39/6e-106,Pkinase/PF00069.20/2.9e-68,Pkinase_Tyr/PF07714.12/1.1e-31,PX/PF00787.19/6.9e-18,APH/PF01636.18/9.8,APH/PF01636.18/0.002,Kinase-like/PF14531.1/1.1e+02,Kinase-like/PF14531.1/0.0017,Pkinase_C/PF00433.19/9.6,Pkinase_C/PF00433.19/0.3 TRINITY_DN20230_c0_g1_i1:290-1831(-)